MNLEDLFWPIEECSARGQSTSVIVCKGSDTWTIWHKAVVITKETPFPTPAQCEFAQIQAPDSPLNQRED